MKATYKEKDENGFRQQLFEPLRLLAASYKHIGKTEKALETYTEAFDSLPQELHHIRSARYALIKMAELNASLGKSDAVLECSLRAVHSCSIAKGAQAVSLFGQRAREGHIF